MHVLIILRQSSALLDATCSWLIFNINGVTLECCVLLCMRDGAMRSKSPSSSEACWACPAFVRNASRTTQDDKSLGSLGGRLFIACPASSVQSIDPIGARRAGGAVGDPSLDEYHAGELTHCECCS